MIDEYHSVLPSSNIHLTSPALAILPCRPWRLQQNAFNDADLCLCRMQEVQPERRVKRWSNEAARIGAAMVKVKFKQPWDSMDLSTDWWEKWQENPMIFMGKSMVSGLDFPINQSIESCMI